MAWNSYIFHKYSTGVVLHKNTSGAVHKNQEGLNHLVVTPNARAFYQRPLVKGANCVQPTFGTRGAHPGSYCPASMQRIMISPMLFVFSSWLFP